jgi:hypothetical protein
MRLFRVWYPLLIAAALLGFAPGRAEAQVQISTRELLPEQRTDAQLAAYDSLGETIRSVYAAQMAHRTRHGRFAADLGAFPELVVSPTLGLSMSGGPDWFVVLGGGTHIGILQWVVSVPPPATAAAPNPPAAPR